MTTEEKPAAEVLASQGIVKLVRIADEYFYLTEHEIGNHDAKPITRTNARALMLSMRIEPEEVAAKTQL